MTVRKHGVVAATLVITIGLGLSARTRTAGIVDAPRRANIAFEVRFGGGYGFAFNQTDGSVTAVAPKDPGGSTMHDKPVLKVLSGTASPAVGTAAQPWQDLTGYELRIDGLATSKVSAPPETALDPDCAKQLASGKNNLAFLPDVGALVPKATVTITKDKLDTQVRLSGGALTFNEVRGCWTVGKRHQAMVMGAKDPAVTFKETLTGNAITVTLVPLGAQPAQKPIVITPNAAGAVVISIDWASAMNAAPVPARKVNDEMKDFSRAFVLLTMPAGLTPGNPMRFALMPNEKPGPTVPKLRPGDDCGSFRYTIK